MAYLQTRRQRTKAVPPPQLVGDCKAPASNMPSESKHSRERRGFIEKGYLKSKPLEYISSQFCHLVRPGKSEEIKSREFVCSYVQRKDQSTVNSRGSTCVVFCCPVTRSLQFERKKHANLVDG